MTNKKTLFKNISIFLCLVPMLVLSLFCLVPKNNIKNVNAGYVSNDNQWFYGSYVNVPVTIVSNSGSYDLTTIFTLACSFGYENGQYKFQVDGYYIRKDLTSIRRFNSRFVLNRADYSTYLFDIPFPEVSGYKFSVLLETGKTFPSPNSVDRVVLGGEKSDDFLYSSSSVYTNTLTYTDGNSNLLSYLKFSFPRDYLHFGSLNSTADIFRNYDFSGDTYFFNLITEDNSNNEYYQQGYSDGYNIGVVDGNGQGYQDGYKAGETVGYNNGYSYGIEHGGKYTFASLFGSVIDVPVNAFTSLLNFELLGVNMLGFITGLLTLALIIFIIKLCMGGK